MESLPTFEKVRPSYGDGGAANFEQQRQPVSPEGRASSTRAAGNHPIKEPAQCVGSPYPGALRQLSSRKCNTYVVLNPLTHTYTSFRTYAPEKTFGVQFPANQRPGPVGSVAKPAPVASKGGCSPIAALKAEIDFHNVEISQNPAGTSFAVEQKQVQNPFAVASGKLTAGDLQSVSFEKPSALAPSLPFQPVKSVDTLDSRPDSLPSFLSIFGEQTPALSSPTESIAPEFLGLASSDDVQNSAYNGPVLSATNPLAVKGQVTNPFEFSRLAACVTDPVKPVPSSYSATGNTVHSSEFESKVAALLGGEPVPQKAVEQKGDVGIEPSPRLTSKEINKIDKHDAKVSVPVKSKVSPTGDVDCVKKAEPVKFVKPDKIVSEVKKGTKLSEVKKGTKPPVDKLACAGPVKPAEGNKADVVAEDTYRIGKNGFPAPPKKSKKGAKRSTGAKAGKPTFCVCFSGMESD